MNITEKIDKYLNESKGKFKEEFKEDRGYNKYDKMYTTYIHELKKGCPEIEFNVGKTSVANAVEFFEKIIDSPDIAYEAGLSDKSQIYILVMSDSGKTLDPATGFKTVRDAMEALFKKTIKGKTPILVYKEHPDAKYFLKAIQSMGYKEVVDGRRTGIFKK